MILADWIASRVGNDSLREAGAHRLEVYAAGLESELAKYEYLPGLLTLERDLFAVLRNPLDTDLVQGVNERLEGLNQIAGTAALYILDRKGLAIAASNWNEEASAVPAASNALGVPMKTLYDKLHRLKISSEKHRV